MAFDPPHGLTETKMFINSSEYGPLSSIYGQHMKNFKDKSYYVTTPRSGFLTLYTLEGGSALEQGQYWSLEPGSRPSSSPKNQRKMDLSPREYPRVHTYSDSLKKYRAEHGIRSNLRTLSKWWMSRFYSEEGWTSVADTTSLMVPRGIYLYEGYTASPKRHYNGGGWLFFLPKDVAAPLFKMQQQMKGGHGPDSSHIRAALQAQHRIKDKWYDEYLTKFTSKERSNYYLTHGNCVENLPRVVRDAISHSIGGMVKTVGGPIPFSGTFVVHQDSMLLSDGGKQDVSLIIRLKFVRRASRTFMRGKDVVNEVSFYYNLVMEWK